MAYSKDIQTLVNAIQNLSSARSMGEITAFVRTAAREIAESDGASFVLKDNGYCFYVDEDAIAPLWKGQRFPLEACVSGWSMQNKQAVIIEDIYKDARVPIDAYRPTFVRSLAITPIRLHSPIGAIGTYWKEIHRPTPSQLEMLQALADTTSVAIENVSLYQSLEARIEELKIANHAKNEFLMTLSHELRTPLNSISGWTEMLSEQKWEDPEVGMGFEAIRRNTEKQILLTEELLDISQMVSGRIEIKREAVDFVKAIEKAESQLAEEAKKKGITIDWIERPEKALVMGDEGRLRQIAFHLLSNAVKFSPQNSTVTVWLKRNGPHYLLQVQDEGVGIEKSFLPYLFDIFRQANSSITRQFGGLGLGLSLVKYLAEAHHGKIEASSEGSGRGARFDLSIPAYEYASSFHDRQQTVVSD